MNVVKVNDNQALSMKAADIIEEALHTLENPVFGLATGSTPEKLYDILIERYQAGKLSFQHATTFNLDEYVGISHDDVNSYQYYMDTRLFHHIDLPKENAHVPNGSAQDPEQEAAAYEEQIKAAGKVNVQILGIGLNGHIGFNEPGTPADSRTRVVALDESTREANARNFDRLEDVPTHAISMGIATIMEAEKIVLLIQGEKKRDILKKLLESEVTPDLPASILHKHRDVTIITDIDV